MDVKFQCEIHCTKKIRLFYLESYVNVQYIVPDINLYTEFYCATIAYHVGLNANSGGGRTPANDQEKWTFGFG